MVDGCETRPTRQRSEPGGRRNRFRPRSSPGGRHTHLLLELEIRSRRARDPVRREDRARIRALSSDDLGELEIDSRLDRRPTKKIIYKRSASCFKGTDLHDNLSSLGIDTLIVTGVQTSHCVYATCRDAVDSYRVIVPQDAVGDRCELMHEVNLLDIELELADVLPRSQVIEYLEEVA